MAGHIVWGFAAFVRVSFPPRKENNRSGLLECNKKPEDGQMVPLAISALVLSLGTREKSPRKMEALCMKPQQAFKVPA